MATGGGINVGGIQADLQLNSGNLERGLARARQAMDTCERELRNLDAELNRGSISMQDYALRTQAVHDLMADLAPAMQAANHQIAATTGALGVVNARLNGASNSSAAMARGMMQVGYAIDDLQYGFAGVVNNIAPLTYSFSTAAGMSTAAASGIASAAQIIVVAGYQAYKHWDKLMKVFDLGIPTPMVEGVERLKDELKELEKVIDALHAKKRLSLVESEDLKNNEQMAKSLKERIQADKDLEDLSGPTKEEKARGSAFEDAVKEHGLDNVKEALQAQFESKFETEGQTLDPGQIRGMLKDKGFDLSKGDMDSAKLADINKMMGTNLKFDELQKKSDAVANEPSDRSSAAALIAGPLGILADSVAGNGKDASINTQIIKALTAEKYAPGKDDKFRTLQGTVEDTILRGKRGDKDAAETVGLATDTMEDKEGLTASKFSSEYNKNSPEAKEAAEKEKAEAKVQEAEAKRIAQEIADAEDGAQDAFDASNENWKAFNARKTKWIKEQVNALKGGDLEQAAIAGTLTEDQVKDRMLKMGLDKGKTESSYEDVFRRLQLAGGEKIGDRVAKTGENRDTASANIAREDTEKRRKEQADLANKAIPGLDKAIEQNLIVGTAATGNGAGVAAGLKEQIRQMLVNAGVNPDAAKNQAAAAVEEGGDKVNRKVADQSMDQQQEQASAKKSVEVFDAASLAQKMQSSVGDSEAKKQTDIQSKSMEYLSTIAGQTGTTIKFGPGGGAGK